MSFSGKKWKRVKVENAVEFMEAMKANDKLQDFLKQGDTVACYTKQGDGTYTQTVEAGGKVVEEKNFALEKEYERTLPDGAVLKTKYVLEGDTLKEHIVRPDGKKVYIERTFSGDTMKMTVTADEVDATVRVEYKAV